MNGYIKRGILTILGIIFILLGLVGLVLPFLQGFLFLAFGIVLLSVASPTIRSWTERHTRRYPRVHHFVERMNKRVSDFVGL